MELFWGEVAVDATGVYVAGSESPPNAAYLRKYNPDGAELWTRRWGDPNDLFVPQGVTVDPAGVYVFGILQRSGPSFPGSPQFPFARKYDLRGNELWTRQLNLFDVDRTFAAADPTGFYVAALEYSRVWAE